MLSNLFTIAIQKWGQGLTWEDSETRTMVVNPITRFNLAELDELGAAEAWTALRVPAALTDSIYFREIHSIELSEAYHHMAGWNANVFPSAQGWPTKIVAKIPP